MSSANAVKIVVGDWESQREHAVPLRHAVFVVEQQVPLDMELDEFDAVSEHAIAWLGSRAIGTARLLPDGHVGRMAVERDCRRHGVGSALLQTLLARARERGVAVIRLHAQAHARDFYGRFGFVEEGEPFDEAGIPHVAMKCELT